MSGRRELYDSFWSGFLSDFSGHYPDWKPKRHRQAHWIYFPSTKPNLLKYAASWSGQRTTTPHLKAEGFIEFQSKERNKELFDLLHQQKDQLEKVVGDNLEWERKCANRKSTIELWFPSYPIEVVEKERWPEAKQWLLDALGRLRDAFDPMLDRLFV